MPMKYDVVIVGSGPAGQIAAETILSKSSMSVLIIDANPEDYEKPCGGGIPNDCLKEFPFLKRIVRHKTNEIVARYKDTDRPFPIEINMVPRMSMRKLLFRRLRSLDTPDLALGYMFNTRVTKVKRKEHMVILNDKFEVEYKWLIGADGVNSVVGKSIGFKIQKVPIIVAHAKVEPAIHKNTRCVIEFIEDFRGYWWVFPKGCHSNIGLGGDVKGRILKQMFDERVKEHAKLGPFEEIYRSAHLIPSAYNTEQKPYQIDDGHILLCGDAASFINSMTGEGIYYALVGGREAAQVILGERLLSEYPSFHEYLTRIQSLKNDLDKQSIKDAFDRIFCDERTSRDMVDFLFSHSIPKPKALSDDEKKAIYSKL